MVRVRRRSQRSPTEQCGACTPALQRQAHDQIQAEPESPLEADAESAGVVDPDGLSADVEAAGFVGALDPESEEPPSRESFR